MPKFLSPLSGSQATATSHVLQETGSVLSGDNEPGRLQILGGVFKYINTHLPLFIAGIHKTVTHIGRGLKETFYSA